MKQLVLQREASTDTETMGRLSYSNNGVPFSMHTVEQEWRPTAPGGEPFDSCVPAGRYKLIPHIRPNGDQVVALLNPGLAVYYEEQDREYPVGRYMILIHAGNTHEDVVGCIAPGTGRVNQMVTHSRDAMKILMQWIGDDEAELLIKDAD